MSKQEWIKAGEFQTTEEVNSWAELIFTDNGQTLKNMIVDSLENDPEQYACEISNDAFNTGYTFIYTDDAITALGAYGTFDAIAEVVQYEKDNFGDVLTDVSEPLQVANILTLIKGEEILSELQSDFEDIEGYDWSSELDENIASEMIEIIKESL